MPAGGHPSEVLFDSGAQPLVLPVCDHYAGREPLIRKSLALQARLGPLFDVTADCEDGAEVGHEAAHARMVSALLASPENRFERMGVRIHDPRSRHWHGDLEAIIGGAGERLAYVALPKVEDFAAVERVAYAIDDLSQQNGVRRSLPIHVSIETHGGLRAVPEIASHPRVECIAFGLMDYVSGYHGTVPASAAISPGQFEHPLVRRAKAEIAVASHAAGKVPAHNPSTDIRRPETAGEDARRALHEYGFTRMWSIHPSQIGPIVAALTPEPGSIRTAAEILLAGRAAGWGAIRHGDRQLDRSAYRYWWGVLRRARAAGAELPADARAAFFEPFH